MEFQNFIFDWATGKQNELHETCLALIQINQQTGWWGNEFYFYWLASHTHNGTNKYYVEN